MTIECTVLTAVGVPTSSPVEESSVTPLGSVPLMTVHESATPPMLVGVATFTVLFLVNVNGEPAYEMSGASRTMSVNVSVVVAPKAVTVTVCVVLAWASVGVPEMVPLRQFMVKPSGS